MTYTILDISEFIDGPPLGDSPVIRSLCQYHPNRVNHTYVLEGEIGEWLTKHDHNGRIMWNATTDTTTIYFKDPALAMMFKLTWL